MNRLCSIVDCGNPVKARGWCNTHYLRWHRHADPTVLLGMAATHRYCVCQPGYRRTPHLPWQCDFCLRRINPRYDDRIPHEVSS